MDSALAALKRSAGADVEEEDDEAVDDAAMVQLFLQQRDAATRRLEDVDEKVSAQPGVSGRPELESKQEVRSQEALF